MSDPIDDMIEFAMNVGFVSIADGVEGMVRDSGHTIEIGGIRAVREGSGAVGRFLDALPPNRRVVVPYVTSDRLAGMLERRGFVMRQRFDPNVGGWGFVWVRGPLQDSEP